jgi:hypothetical protein
MDLAPHLAQSNSTPLTVTQLKSDLFGASENKQFSFSKEPPLLGEISIDRSDIQLSCVCPDQF